MSQIDHIYNQDKLLAILVPHSYQSSGIEFFTSDELSQQMAYMHHPAGRKIEAHVHNPIKREFVYTNEALFVRKGRVRVDFYGDEREYLWSVIIQAGDVLLLVSSGHGFEILEDCEMIEIKQGPYAGDADKTRFAGIDEGAVKYRSTAT